MNQRHTKCFNRLTQPQCSQIDCMENQIQCSQMKLYAEKHGLALPIYNNWDNFKIYENKDF